MDKEGKGNLFLEEELTLMQDSNFLRTKQLIVKKMELHLRNTAERLKPLVLSKADKFPECVLMKSGKISKGENYRDLPYLVLDYPRYFSKEAVFAFRTMFWWGNFLSCTLHLQGAVLDSYRDKLWENLPKSKGDIYFCIHQTPWEYHYEKDNYLPLAEISNLELTARIKAQDFVKVSRKLAIDKYADLPGFAVETFELFYKMTV